jgi:predicted exporter
MKSNSKVMLISMISLVLIAVVGVSYAYFSAITSGGESSINNT